MARGGKRQGTPGEAYSNRTDLMTDYAAPASGPTAPPAPAPAEALPIPQGMAPPPGPAGFPAVEDTPFLNDPDSAPQTLPGYAGSEGVVSSADRDLTIIKNYLPDMRREAAYDDAPSTFKAFVRWLEQQ